MKTAARVAHRRNHALTATTLLFAAALLLAAGAALAQQAWPVKPLRMIVPFATGGGTDIQARLFSAKLVKAAETGR